MGQSFRAALGAVALGLTGGILTFAGSAYALNDPPSQAGRLAYTEGTVSFHDDEQSGWSPAVINTPLTAGDSIWTEPNARSEVSVAGSRVRMDGGTQLNMLELDDSQTRLQVAQGRIDVKTFAFNPNTPYQIVTPRGTINLRQQGDYYVEAGSTQDATRVGVRSGAAQFQNLAGQILTVNAGQVGEIAGDPGMPQMRAINTVPPAQPSSWAARDRQISYDVPQYLSAGITGYEDLNAYGSWSNDSQYGNVWTPRSVPTGWQPYKNGHWSYVKPWGWTWVDDQPWGYAPSHYGRWANRNNQWVWVPPQRETQPVYAPALVDFIGGVQLVQALLGGGTSIGTQASAPVGWFPLGPREAYVPSYSTDRAYYARLNSSNQVQQQALDERWQRAQRREAYVAGRNNALANQRFTTVVPSAAFVNSQPVARAALQVAPAQIAAAAVAPVSAPPAPTASLAVATPASAPAATANEPKTGESKTVDPKPGDPKAADPKTADPKTAAPAPATDPKAEADAKAKAEAQAKTGANANLPVAKTAVADMPTLAKPTTPQKPAAPGPKLATAPNVATPNATGNATVNTTTPAKNAVPPLVPRTGTAPPALKDDNKAPATATPAPAATPQTTAPQATTPQAKAPAATDAKPQAAPAATPPVTPPAAAQPATKPEATPKPATAEPAKPAPAPPAPQANKPADPPKPAAPAPQQAAPQPAKPEAPRAAQPATPPQTDNRSQDKGAAATPQQPTTPNAPAAQPPKPPAIAQQPAPKPAENKRDESQGKPDDKKPDDKK